MSSTADYLTEIREFLKEATEQDIGARPMAYLKALVRMVDDGSHPLAERIAWLNYHALAYTTGNCGPILDQRCLGCAELAILGERT